MSSERMAFAGVRSRMRFSTEPLGGWGGAAYVASAMETQDVGGQCACDSVAIEEAMVVEIADVARRIRVSSLFPLYCSVCS